MNTIAPIEDLPVTRDAIERLVDAMQGMPQLDLHTEHVINGGMYARTITIPAGATLVGAAHKTDHINVVDGDITVSTEHGRVRLTGHHVLATPAGTQRSGFAHAETVWTTIVRTDLTTVEAIENEVVETPERLQTRTLQLDAANAPQLED